jgi:hypothetical protein
MANPLIYVGRIKYGGFDAPTLSVFDYAKNLILEIKTGGTVQGVAADQDGYIYLNSNDWENNLYTTRKYRPNGELVWSNTHGGTLGRIALDSSNNVYTVGAPVNNSGQIWVSGSRTGYYTTRKYNSSGSLQWSADHGAFSNYYNLQPIATRSDGSLIVTGGYSFESVNIRAVNSSGVSQWTLGYSDGIANIQALAIDGDGNVYAGGANNGYALYKISSSGTITATYSGDIGVVRAIRIDSSGNLIVLTTQVNYRSGHKFDSSLNLIWSGDANGTTGMSGNSATDIALDSDDYIYRALSDAMANSGYQIFDSDGIIQVIDSSEITASSIAVSEPRIPPIPLHINLASPTLIGTTTTFAPAVRIPFLVSIPRLKRLYVGTSAVSVTRVFLTGSPDIEIQAETINCRIDSQFTTFTVFIPATSIDLIESIGERIDGYLIVKKGVRFFDETEQLDEMWRAQISEPIQYDFGANSASISLTAKSATTISASTIAISEITYRNTNNGIRRIRCRFNQNILPGDTIDMGGGETMAVGDMSCYITKDSETMEIAEAAA